MEEVQKKKRTKHFTESEKLFLLELVQDRCKILENKATNNCSVKEKEDCWEDLQMVFMSLSKGVIRTVQSLKTCWENMKKRTKKQYAEEKQLMYTTGGGPCKVIHDPIAEQVRKIIAPAEGLSNAFDSDYITRNTSDGNEQCAEEWLEEGVIEEGIGFIEEDDIEGDKENIERNDNGRRGDECDTEEDVVLQFLLMDTLSWKKWNPQQLQTPISTPLKTSVDKKKSTTSVDHVTSSQTKKSKANDVVSSVPKRIVENTSSKLKQKNHKENNSKFVKFDTLADNKIELVHLMMDNGKEKHGLEIGILKLQLQKEGLQVQIMQKELELKTVVLEKEKRRIDNMQYI